MTRALHGNVLCNQPATIFIIIHYIKNLSNSTRYTQKQFCAKMWQVVMILGPNEPRNNTIEMYQYASVFIALYTYHSHLDA